MGESGQVVVFPGSGDVKTRFEDRGMVFSHDNEIVTANYYSVELETTEQAKILVEQSASTHRSDISCQNDFHNSLNL
jgi:hypothetical protein